MRKMKMMIGAVVALLAAACSTSTYSITDPKTGKELQRITASAPGGDSFVLVVYYGADKTPIVQAGGDSTSLVEATAAAGRKAVALALRHRGP